MAEPSTSITAGAVATGAVTIAGSIAGVPADVLLSGVVGAALSMSRNSKLSPSLGAVTQAAGVFALSLAAAVFAGPVLAMLLQGMLEAAMQHPMPAQPLRVAAPFLMALGAQRFVPAMLDRIGGSIERGKQGGGNG